MADKKGGAVAIFKVVLVGDAKGGKTSLLNRWAHDAFTDNYEPTVSPEFTTKEVSVDGKVVRLQVWDMGFGEPDTASQFPRYAGGASGALLIYDMSDAGSFDGVAHWKDQVCSVLGSQCAFVVVGCKADKGVDARLRQRAQEFAGSVGAEHLETSVAGDGSNGAPAFEAIARAIVSGPTPGQTNVASMETTPQLPPEPPNGRQLSRTNTPGEPPAKLCSLAVSNGLVKLVLLGEPGVGKSSLVSRLGGEDLPFEEDYTPTPGPEITTRHITVRGNKVKVQMWDASGDDLMHNSAVCVPVMQRMNAALVVYDVTMQPSFDSIDTWLRLLQSQAGSEVMVMIVGNKTDLQSRAVSAEQARQQAERLRIPYMEVSAKYDGDLAEMIDTLIARERPVPNWELVSSAGAAATPGGTTPTAAASPLSRGGAASQLSLTTPGGFSMPKMNSASGLGMDDTAGEGTLASRIVAARAAAAARQGKLESSPSSRLNETLPARSFAEPSRPPEESPGSASASLAQSLRRSEALVRQASGNSGGREDSPRGAGQPAPQAQRPIEPDRKSVV